MTKFGVAKKSVHDRAAEEQVAHQHVPGKAYNVTDPVTRLMHIVGGGFFNEPKYYDSNRSYETFAAELRLHGCIRSTILDDMGLTEQANEVISTAIEVANSDNPEALLLIAAWARDRVNGLKLRSTPQVLLAIAAACPKTKPYVARYATSIIQRPDEIRQVFGIFRHLFMGSKSVDASDKAAKRSRAHYGAFPHCLRKGLARALAASTDKALLKYNGDDSPKFSDVLKMVGGSRKVRSASKNHENGWPVSKAMFEYLVNGKYVEPLTPTLAARKAFFETTEVTSQTADLIKTGGLTWENVIAHLGSKRETWELVIPYMNEMALTRNLRNFEGAGISEEAWTKVYDSLESVEHSVQLPFRFFTAFREITSTQAKTVLGQMLDRTVDNVSDLPGVTAVFTDNSGSAVGCAISGKSKVTVSDCGNMLEAVLAKKLGRRALIGVFGDCFMWVPFNAADSCLTIKGEVDRVAKSGDRTALNALCVPSYKRGKGTGGGTETGLWFGLDDLTKRKVHVDRIILLSDLCCYTLGDCHYHDLTKYFGSNATVQGMIDKYRASVNKDCKVYSVNLSGHAQAQTRPSDPNSHLLSGWSEKMVDMINDLERGTPIQTQQAAPEKAKPVKVPVIDVLRERYAIA